MPHSLTRRQIEILALVQQNPGQLTHEDICSEFNIEIATLHRDIRSLKKAGVEIISRKKKLKHKGSLNQGHYHQLLSSYLAASSHVIGYPKSIQNVCRKLKDKTLIIFRSLVYGIENRKVITIIYKKLYYGEIVKRRIETYDIIPAFHDWRLIAFSDGIFKQFLVDNIQDIEIHDERFTRNESYNVNDVFRNSITYWTGDEEYTVVLRFNRSAAQLVKDTIWSEHQEIKKLPGGKIELTLKVNSIPHIGNWVMGWGGAVEVVKPQQLKRYLEKQARDILKTFRKGK